MNQKKYGWLILFLFSAVPVFFINIQNTHDWGDDFAQYLMQARNIVEDRPQNDNGYVHDSIVSHVALKAYPAGWPLILSKIYVRYGLNMVPYNYLMSAMLVIFAAGCFLFFSRFVKNHFAFLMAIIILYNPWCIQFKKEILSDLPFAACALLYLHFLLNCEKKINVLAAALFAAVMINIRAAGWAFILSHASYSIFVFLKEKNKVKLFESIFISATALIIYIFINTKLYPTQGGSFIHFYADAAVSFNPAKSLAVNLHYYTEVFGYFLSPPGVLTGFIASLAKIFGCATFFIGLFLQPRNKIRFQEFWLGGYLLLILFYPYSQSGVRFLLPVLPVIIMYCIDGSRFLIQQLSLPKTKIIYGSMLLMFISYIPETKKIITQSNKPLDGPYLETSREMIQYLQQHLPPASTVAFYKPRALSLFTDMKSTSWLVNQKSEAIRNLFERTKVDYIVQDNEIKDAALDYFIWNEAKLLNKLWNNDRYALYIFQGKIK